MMKTTVNLPDSLVKQVKMRAVREGQKLQDAVAELLRLGLSAAKVSGERAAIPVVIRDAETDLPVIQCQRPPAPEEISADRIAEILSAQDVEFHAAGR